MHNDSLPYSYGRLFAYIRNRRDATRVELKMHLRAHTGAQRVTRRLFVHELLLINIISNQPIHENITML